MNRISANRSLVYFIRKHLPENQFIHNVLTEWKLRGLKSKLIPEKYVKRGENNPSEIPEIVRKYEKEKKSQVQQLTQSFDLYLKKAKISYTEEEYSSERANMLFYCLAYGFAPDEYVFYKLRDKSVEEVRKYLTDTDRYITSYMMNDFKNLLYLVDKAATYEKYGKYYKRDAISVSSKADFEKFKDFSLKHDELVIKEVSASCGQGVRIEKADRNNFHGQFDGILKRGKCIVEERIVQSDIMNRFNTSSVNTVRVISFNTQQGIVIGPCILKTGREGSFVDNAGAGGIISGIERKSGVVDSCGYDEYNNKYEHHPSSGLSYLGFQLPEWEECINMVKEMCNIVPKIGYIGWDLAHSVKGWVLVEANSAGQFVLPQICYQRGFKEEIQKYINDRYVYR